MDPSTLAKTIASQGLLGIMLVGALYVAYRKDKDLQDERTARIADAKTFNELALKIQAGAIDTVNKLSDIFEEMKKTMGARP